jgi:hypothetical protein
VIDGGLGLARITTTASHSLDDDQAALSMVRANHAELLHPASGILYLNEQLGCDASLRGTRSNMERSHYLSNKIGSPPTRLSKILGRYVHLATMHTNSRWMV